MVTRRKKLNPDKLLRSSVEWRKCMAHDDSKIILNCS